MNQEVIWEQLKAVLDASGMAERDEQGHYTFVVPAEYGYHSEFLIQPAYDYRGSADLMGHLMAEIDDMLFDDICTWENKILKDACFDQNSLFYEEARAVLLKNVTFVPEYDYFLKDRVCVNLLLGTEEERNRDFSFIEESLDVLLQDQGYSTEDYEKTVKEFDRMFHSTTTLDDKIKIFNDQHSPFLTSVYSELENHNSSMGCLTVLAKLSFEELATLFPRDGKGGIVSKEIILPKDTMLGIFDPWHGGGSVMEICLEKDLKLSNQLIWDYQIEGAKEQAYTVKHTYGFLDDAWKEPLMAGHEKVQDERLPKEPKIRTIQ